jgi:hypothetical protein
MLETAIQFLAENLPVLKAIFEAVQAGVTADRIVAIIKAEMVAVSNTAMREALK